MKPVLTKSSTRGAPVLIRMSPGTNLLTSISTPAKHLRGPCLRHHSAKDKEATEASAQKAVKPVQMLSGKASIYFNLKARE